MNNQIDALTLDQQLREMQRRLLVLSDEVLRLRGLEKALEEIAQENHPMGYCRECHGYGGWCIHQAATVAREALTELGEKA